VDRGPLERHLGQVVANGLAEPSVRVGDDELDAGEPALDELREELAPGRLASSAPMVTARSCRCPSRPMP